MADAAPRFIEPRVAIRRSLRQTMRWDRDLPADLVERFWRDPRGLLSSGETLQQKSRCIVARIQHAGSDFLLKHHNWGGPIRTLKKSLRRAPAVQCFHDGRFLAAAGFPTPTPRACLQRCVGPIGGASYLLTDFIAGATLYRHLRFDRPSASSVRPLAEQVAALWQQLDDLRVTHNDLKTENFQIDRRGRVWLIDLEKMRRHRGTDELRRRQVIDLGRFFHPRNWRSNPAIAEVFRPQILATSAGSELAKTVSANHPLVTPRPVANRTNELVTVLIPHDGEPTSACLESICDFADEILIDPSLPSAVRRARHPWVLLLLPQEHVSPDLAKEIQDALANQPKVDGFRIERRQIVRGQSDRWRAFRGDWPIRLFRAEVADIIERNSEPEIVLRSKKNTGRLRSKLLYDIENVRHQTDRRAA